MRSKLLIITNRLIVGGISNDIVPLAWYLKDEFEILIISGEKEEDEAEINFLLKLYPGLQFKKIDSFRKNINPFNDRIAYTEIKREIKNFKPDIVHTHGAKSGLMGRLAAYKSKVPCIMHTYHGHHFHSYYNTLISSALTALERMLGRITTVVIAISKWQKKELTETYKIVPEEKVKIIPLGIEPARIRTEPVTQRFIFRKKYKVEDDTIAIGIAGRIVPVKNLKLFVQVAKDLIAGSTKRLCFFIIGDGFLKKQIEEQCAALNLPYTENEEEKADIIFTSWIEDIIPAIHAMDIVALTSNNEGTPMSLIEAQFCGKPVVATDVGGVKDIVLDNETGFLVKAGDAAKLVERLKLLIENESLRKEMGAKAEAFAEENFSKQREVENYRQLYQNLLTPKNMKHSVPQHA
ncbi:MAG TPA: glycosyltransferase family 4 protein [Parafilimonas sp.]|nr:glycosyltransferase family 4 protein [Parafilimonas sp.]